MLKTLEEQNGYNTTIKDIAGIGDITLLYDFLSDQNSVSDNSETLQSTTTTLGVRTEKTTSKVLWAIKKTLLVYYGEEHKELITDLFNKDIPSEDKSFIFFWHFALMNKLFRDISVNVFSKIYYSGRVSISQDDIIPYIKEIKGEDGQPLWSDSTIYRLATKYLSLMTKLNFVEIGRIKSFKHIRPSSEVQILFLYISKLYASESRNLLNNKLLPLSFIPIEDLNNRLKKLSLKGYFNMDFNGVKLNIELTHKYKGICDALYN
ncbi:MAG: hypothetical protein B6229_00010 [Spirochaetaceae bacterium 4572_7]|nr:MAG: hypothetical protein B6229_00010 [Spirochaetaceae bacterium 4572_7]